MLPIPRDLNEPEGWRFSSLRYMLHPAERERGREWMRGVSIQGLGVSSAAREPILRVSVGLGVVV